jgi:hypothetical protein
MFSRKKHATPEQEAERHEAKIKALRDAVEPLSGSNSKYVTEACLKRYLEARNLNLEKSRKMLEESLKWRSTYKPEEIRWNEVAIEGETGKLYRAKFHDREGRTVLVLKPGKQNTNSHEGQLRHLVYMLENAIINLPEEQEQMIWLIDFTGWSLSNAVPMRTARDTANILQNHYPERLANAFLYNPPKVFEAFWKVVKYFLDPKTSHKVNFVYSKNEESIKVMHKYFDPEVLPLEFGGKNKVEYDHEEFTKMMEKDDIKTAAFWGLEDKVGPLSEQLTNETPCVAAQAN